MSQSFTTNFSNGSQNTAITVSEESVETGCNPIGASANNNSDPSRSSSDKKAQKGHQHGPNCKHDHDGGHGQAHDQFDEEGGHVGHDHGHGHGGHGGHDGHDHGHGGKRGHSSSHRRNKMFQDHAWGIRGFTLGMPTQGGIICLFWLNEVLAENPFEWWLSTVFMVFGITMCYISYYNATFCEPYAPARGIPVFVDQKSNTLCKVCNKWKPDRSHHCSTCGKCVLKMDHHCPWIVNCVGHKNHKAFMLFCFFMAISAIHYLWRSLVYLVWSYENGRLFEHSIIFLIWWFLVTLIIGPVCLMLTGLSFYHSGLALNNTTTLDSMGGGGMQMPCVPEKFYFRGKYRYINIYDQGMFANLCDFLGRSYLLFWYPNIKPVTDEGVFYSTIPTMTPYEIALKLPPTQIQGEEFNPYLMKRPVYLSDFNAEEYFQRALEYTHKKHLQFDTRILEYGKRNDNSSIADA